MKARSSPWIEILAAATAIAFALALLIATLGAAAGAVSGGETGQAAPQTYDGMITDTYCGAKHDAGINRSASDCVRICVHSGNSFALLSGEKLYVLNGDLDALKALAGTRVRISGTLQGNTLAVTSAVALT
jgi:hypothetical protein